MAEQKSRKKAVIQQAIAQVLERRLLLSQTPDSLAGVVLTPAVQAGTVMPLAQAQTSTVITTSNNSTTYGQSITFTATITPSSGSGETGTVQFQLPSTGTNGNLGSPVTVVNNIATYTTTSLGAGSWQVSAVYSGDANFAGSTSSSIAQTVVKAANAWSLGVVASFNVTNGSYPRAGVTMDSLGDLFGTTQSGGSAGDGTIFEIVAGSGVVTTLATFTGTSGNGSTPYGGVVLDSSGNLFGTTEAGGIAGCGTVFEFTPSLAKSSPGTLSTLASFYGFNGLNPYSGVVLDSSGNLFGIANAGGLQGYGVVFEVAHGSTSITSLASFNSYNGEMPRGSLLLDSSGDLFGTTRQGGASIYGSVFELPHGSATLTTVASFNGSGGVNPSGGVIMDSAGDLFGTAASGGANSHGVVFEIAHGSGSITTLGLFYGTNGSDPESGLVFDSSGNLFGTAVSGGGANYGTVFEIAHGTSTITLLAALNTSYGGNPYSTLLIDSSGDLFGTTNSPGLANGTVFEVTPPESITVTSNLPTAVLGQQITFTASITPDVGAGATGTVQFLLNGSNLGNPVAVTGAAATYTIALPSPLPIGSYSITAVYSGDANFASATSAVFTQTVTKGVETIRWGVNAIVSFPANSGSNGNPEFYSGLIADSSGDLFGTTSSGGAYGDGSVFEMASGSQNMTTLVSFNGVNGSGPSGGVVRDSVGDIFGVTMFGGSGAGTVFEIAHGASAATTLAAFNVLNGAEPNSGVVLDGSGNLFGAAPVGGGNNNDGTVFEVAHGSGAITALASFNGANGINPTGSLVVDSSGDVFGTTLLGGANGDGAVFELVHGSGSLTALASFSARNFLGGLIMDCSGDLFGSMGGGAYGDGAIFEIAQGTTVLITLASFAGWNGSGDYDSLVLDPSGNLFGASPNTMFEIAKGSGVITPLGAFTVASGLFAKGSIVLDSLGDIFGTTTVDGANTAGTVFELMAAGSATSYYGQRLTLTASVGPFYSIAQPTGTVQFQVDGVNVGSPVSLTGGFATYQTSTLGVGSHSITAAYSGDGVYSPSASLVFTQTILALPANSITGTVFIDTNADGIFGASESGFPSVTVTLTPTGSTTGSPVTVLPDSTGMYQFTNINPGTYLVTETPPTNYALSSPIGGSGSVAVVAGQGSAGPIFGNVQISSVTLNFAMLVELSQNYGKPGTFITGDLNGDGTVSFTDLVLLSQNYNGTLPPSDYASAAVMAPALVSASAMIPALFPVAPKAVATTIATVAQTTGSISGVVFNDISGDGVQEKGEAGLAARTVYLRIPGAATRGQRISTTNAAGQFSFTNVPAGNYLIAVSMPTGWRSTTVPSDSGAITLTGGASVRNLAFGQTQTASIAGSVYLDASANQKRDAGEAGLAGWVVTLTNSVNPKITFTANTDALGNYTVPAAPAGQYVLSVAMKSGYAPSSPAGGRYVLHVYAAQTLTGKNFGVLAEPVAISAVRTVDPYNKSEDLITFYALDNGTGAWAGSSELLAEDLTLSCASGLEIRTYDANGAGMANDADLTGQNAKPTASFIRLNGPSFFVASTTPSASTGGFVDHQPLGSFEVAGALLTGGVSASAGQGARVAVAVVKHGASVKLAGSLAADVGSPVAVSFVTT